MDRTGNTVYIKIDQNVLVHKSDVHFSDIGSVECTDKTLLAKIRAMKVYSFGRHGNVVMSVLKIIEQIHGIDPKITVVNEGETDFILEYRPKAVDDWVQTLKVILICVVIFFGTAFTIAAFHNDIGITDVFEQLYTQVTGREETGSVRSGNLLFPGTCRRKSGVLQPCGKKEADSRPDADPGADAQI